MKNLDLRQEILTNMSQAIQSGDKEAMEKAMVSLGNYYTEMVENTMNGAMNAADQSILAGRGIRQLTSGETKYYQAFIEAAKSADVKQAITNIDVAFPKTIIDAVLDDIEAEHPLLAAIDFQNTSLLTSYIYSNDASQLATWGALNSMASSDLAGAIDSVDLNHCKLTARMCVSNDLLEAGPAWVDRYVRGILTDALATALETAVVKGTGSNQPIGMDRACAPTDTVTSGAYSQKTATAITDLTQKTIGKLKAAISTRNLYTYASDGTATKSGTKSRPVKNLILVVNPSDMYEYIEPAMYVLTPGGFASIVKDDIQVIPSVAVTTKTAVFGMADRYLMAIGTPKEGKLEFDDSVKFLDDQRAYRIKLRGNGRPKDDNAFLYLTFTSLKEAALPTRTVS